MQNFFNKFTSILQWAIFIKPQRYNQLFTFVRIQHTSDLFLYALLSKPTVSLF